MSFFFFYLSYPTQAYKSSALYEINPPGSAPFWKTTFHLGVTLPCLALRATNLTFGLSLNLENSIMSLAVVFQYTFYTFTVLLGNLVALLCRRYQWGASHGADWSWNKTPRELGALAVGVSGLFGRGAQPEGGISRVAFNPSHSWKWPGGFTRVELGAIGAGAACCAADTLLT